MLASEALSITREAQGPEARLRVLVVTPRFPYPVIGGDRLRIVNLCRELAKSFDVTLVSLCATRAEMGLDVPADGVFRSVHRVYHPRWRSVLKTLAALPTGRPLQVAYFQSSSLERKVRELCGGHDVLLAHLVRAADYVLGRGKPAVVEMTDAISMNYERVRSIGSRVGAFQSWVYGFEWKRIWTYEREVAQRAELSIFVSEVDREYLFKDRPELKERTLVLSNGVDAHALPYAFASGGARICFIGNMSTLQNLDAAHYFADAVLPRIREVLPQATFEVVGRIEPKGRRVLEGMKGVRVIGSVSDIAAAVRGAAVGVCPVRLGAGIQNKLLEYMSLGLPAVTSALGLEGLPVRPGVEVLVADSPEDTAGCVIRLLQDRAYAQSIAEAARRCVTEHHSWPGILSPLRERIMRVATGPELEERRSPG